MLCQRKEALCVPRITPELSRAAKRRRLGRIVRADCASCRVPHHATDGTEQCEPGSHGRHEFRTTEKSKQPRKGSAHCAGQGGSDPVEPSETVEHQESGEAEEESLSTGYEKWEEDQHRILQEVEARIKRVMKGSTPFPRTVGLRV